MEDPTLYNFTEQIYREGNKCQKYGPNKGQRRTSDELTWQSAIKQTMIQCTEEEPMKWFYDLKIDI